MPTTTPESSRIEFAPYQIDVEGIARFVYEHFLTFLSQDFESFYATLSTVWYFYSIAAFTISVLLLFGISYAIIREGQLSEEEVAMLEEAERAYHGTTGEPTQSARWQQVLDHVSADDPGQWRLAIMEADIMLDDVLTEAGYVGESLGEKLKSANPEMFRSIEDAWQAHKVRNGIAHKGSDFVLTKKAAQDAIAQYQRVFEEFHYI